MSIAINLDIIETDKQLERLMILEVVKQFNKLIPTGMININKNIRLATFEFLKNTPTYDSLISGDLAGHFGIPAAGRSTRIDNILLAVSNGMNIQFIPMQLSGSKVANGIICQVLTTNLSEVIDLAEGDILTKKGDVLQWLRWLLTFGSKIIVSEYEIRLISGKGRSGRGIMVANDASIWRVPGKYSGTMRNNWLTRALKDNSSAYLSIIEKIIKTELQRI